ncbi:MAG: DUF418 domain-containing protein [Bacteroidales bacterium]|nr:DUF418 domain-containing protein [Bacteroidales bacterium]
MSAAIDFSKTNSSTETASPVRQRIVILDALRGFALFGIALANFPEFSLYDFLHEFFPTGSGALGYDTVARFLQALFVNGKFYTIFSVLFGIGFSIIISNVRRRGLAPMPVFYRRMVVLALIGFAHLMLLWSGDILLLYALCGMILPLFDRCCQRTILISSVVFLSLPVLVSLVRPLLPFSLPSLLYDSWWSVASSVGISEDNFALFLHDADSYADVHRFLLQGAVERCWEFVSSSRYFKVVGLFLLGFYIGRSGMLSSLSSHTRVIYTAIAVGLFVALPLSVVSALSSIGYVSLSPFIASLLYLFGVYPLGLAYMAALALLYIHLPDLRIWRFFALTGRMALSCYILQSLFGVFLFYGVGLAFGGTLSLCETLLVATAVFLVESILCALWLRFFKFGPLEWLWRILTYLKIFPIR